MAEIDGKPVAGIGRQMNEAAPPYWTTYISVTNADAATAVVSEAGGTVVVAPFDVVGAGRMAVLADPTGAPISVWEAQAHTGSGIVDEPGSMCWHELYTRDPEAAKTFYESAFGWSSTEEDMGGSRYTVWKLGDQSVGGMVVLDEQMPAELPPHWLVYFAVDDCDAAVAHVSELGGSVKMQPMDVPPGRFAVVSDPHGALFAVMALRRTASEPEAASDG
jgi:predicted enzyme related to lactoylglutathione lyase